MTGGLRYDISTLSYCLLPLFILHLFFFVPWNNRVYQAVLKVIFHLSNTVLIVLNCIDLEYFKFTFKRSSSDLLELWSLGKDVERQSAQLIVDYWYLFFVAFFLILLSEALYRKLEKPKTSKGRRWANIFWTLSFAVLLVVGARGGIQLKPLNVIQAGQYTTAQNIAVVLNTPFTLLKSIGKTDLTAVNYYSKEQLEEIYEPIIQIEPDGNTRKLNVVLIILEGFSAEYIGYLNDYEGYTPFLDSLMSKSLIFTNAFANGKKSIESLPAILAGIPALSENPYISSTYSSNKINSLASELTKVGYQSSFYHGGANGTMGFNAFANMAGIENYFGLNEYPNAKRDYDGNWGIFDEEYLQYFNRQLSKKQRPFFASVFTLSSHHPYTIPEKYENKFKKGTLNIHESIGYTDHALQLFFEAASKEKYYSNTLFVLVADHTAQTQVPYYQGRSGMYRIPLIFHYKDQLKGKSAIVCQQSDIFPSVLDYLHIPAKFVCFGNSVFNSQHNSPHFSINYLSGIYQYIEGDYALLFDGEKPTFLYNFKKDPQQKINLLQKKQQRAFEMEKKLKAIIQQYNNRLLNNNLSLD